MNLFFLDSNPFKAAKYNVDKHCLKIILESAQMLCYAFPENLTPIKNSKKGFYFHPMSKFVRESYQNWTWTLDHFSGLLNEFEYRFNKKHSYVKVLDWLIKNQKFLNFENYYQTSYKKWPQCFGQYRNECYVKDDPILGYQNYYNVAKRHLFQWTKREIPYFIKI